MPSTDLPKPEALIKTGALLQRAILNSANFSSIATDAQGVIQVFNVGAETMLGYTAVEVVNKITPADISDPAELIARATALSFEPLLPRDSKLLSLRPLGASKTSMNSRTCAKISVACPQWCR